MTKHAKFVSALSSAALLLGACSAPPPIVQTPQPKDPVAAQIDVLMSAPAPSPLIRRNVGPETPVPKAIYTPTVTVSYLGDARILLDEAARANGMTFAVSGPQPHLPIFVQVHVKDLAMEAFLEQVALQLSQRADLHFRKGRKILELRYRGAP